jgi:L,D-transpeptidase YbiS
MPSDFCLNISIADQTLELIDQNQTVLNRYSISTAANGAGEIMDSGCTPTGKHIIRAKIGEGERVNTVFRGRRATGEIYQTGMREQQPGRDWILTRIMWLSGCEPGFNRLKDRDTMRRYIYIHGTPDEVAMGEPGSAGCIRMRNSELLTVFNLISVGTPVDIYA